MHRPPHFVSRRWPTMEQFYTLSAICWLVCLPVHLQRGLPLQAGSPLICQGRPVDALWTPCRGSTLWRSFLTLSSCAGSVCGPPSWTPFVDLCDCGAPRLWTCAGASPRLWTHMIAERLVRGLCWRITPPVDLCDCGASRSWTLLAHHPTCAPRGRCSRTYHPACGHRMLWSTQLVDVGRAPPRLWTRALCAPFALSVHTHFA